MEYLKRFLKSIGWIAIGVDLLVAPLTIISGLFFRVMKFIGVKKFPINNSLFHKIGFFPIVNHYYEPQFDFKGYSQKIRHFEGINFNSEAQLTLLHSFEYKVELDALTNVKSDRGGYFFSNGSFESGDAECYYSLIRKFKPKKIIEVGSGYSTLMAVEAIKLNRMEGEANMCTITCIEPYEMQWLSDIEVELLTQKVEDADLGLFEKLEAGDILFIDSSHIIRPEGDVLFEIFEILPRLNPGVLIHFHDIFTPLNYPEKWLKEEFRMWNEQYLLEAFLSYNAKFEVVLVLSYLTIYHKREVCDAFPVYAKDAGKTLGSFWIRRL